MSGINISHNPDHTHVTATWQAVATAEAFFELLGIENSFWDSTFDDAGVEWIFPLGLIPEGALFYAQVVDSSSVASAA